ncbi:succinate dehydrogenase subunit C [Bacillus sp. OV194]|nr:succinate dehydrogenase subunit C [Bacillus sp. OV194]
MADISSETSHRMLHEIDPSVHKIEALPRHSVGIKVWLIHRITGVGLLIYLLSHIATMSTAIFLGDQAFERTFDVLFHTPIFVVFDVLILAGLILHGLNGIRLIVMEMGYFVIKQKQKQLLAVTLIISAILFIWLFSRAFL